MVTRKGRVSVTRAVVFYRCGGTADGEAGYSTYGRLKVRKGRFAKDSINQNTWMSLGSRDGDEVVSSDSY